MSCADLSVNVAASLQPSASFVMLGLKRDRAGRPQGNRHGELGAQLRDLVAENKLPTTRIESLVGGVRDIVPQALPALPRVRRGLNLSHPYRSYARAFLRGSVWPRVYWAHIRCMNIKSKRQQPHWMAFWLTTRICSSTCESRRHDNHRRPRWARHPHFDAFAKCRRQCWNSASTSRPLGRRCAMPVG